MAFIVCEFSLVVVVSFCFENEDGVGVDAVGHSSIHNVNMENDNTPRWESKLNNYHKAP